MGTFIIPKNTTAVQGIPVGRLSNLESRVSALESGGGSGSGYQSPSGIVDGSNTVFVFATAPSALSIDGVIKRKTQTNGVVNWTGTTTVTLTVAPTFDCFAVA